jgi:hypothetical protein
VNNEERREPAAGTKESSLAERVAVLEYRADRMEKHLEKIRDDLMKLIPDIKDMALGFNSGNGFFESGKMTVPR